MKFYSNGLASGDEVGHSITQTANNKFEYGFSWLNIPFSIIYIILTYD